MTLYRKDALRWFFTLAYLEWLAALGFFLVNYLGNVTSSGYSIKYITLLIFLLGICFLAGWFVVSIWRKTAKSELLLTRLSSWLIKANVYWAVIAIAGINLLLTFYYWLAYVLLIRSGLENLFIAPYLVYLGPFSLIWILITLQGVIALRLTRLGNDLTIFSPYRRAFRAALIALAFLVMLSVFIIFTKFGLTPDEIGWGAPGVPILHTQVLLALALTAIIFLIAALLMAIPKLSVWIDRVHLPAWGIDLFVCVLLWGIAGWLWGAEPIQASYFSPAPLPPNYEIYPNSDAIHYDMSAQKLLIGFGFDRDAIRPLYVLFLAMAHAISGTGYIDIIPWQIAILALIPVLLYILAKHLHHRFAGLLTGILVIFHERNSIALAGDINVSHAKMILSDLTITLGVVIFTLLIVLWFQNPNKKRMYPLLAGGVLALFMLVRTQVVLLLPVALILLLIFFWRRPSLWLKNGILMVATVILVLSPWLWRNKQVTGKIGLSEMSNPTQASVIRQRYSLLLQPAEPISFTGKPKDEDLSKVTGSVSQFILENPLEVSRFILTHFLNNEVATGLVLPASLNLIYDLQRFNDEISELYSGAGSFWEKCCSQKTTTKVWEKCCSLKTYSKILPFWNKWDGSLLGISWLSVLVNLCLLAIGLGVAWNRWGVIGLIPLIINLGYSMSNAVIRNSGWRYNLPVDWVGILYYAIGLAQLCFWIGMFLSNRLVPRLGAGLPALRAESVTLDSFPWKKAIPTVLVMVMVTAMLPIMERVVPNRYQNMNPDTALALLDREGLLQNVGLNAASIQAFLGKEGAVSVIGRGLYPRYFKGGKGDKGVGWPSGIPNEYDRLGFYVSEANRHFVVLPLNQAPEYFPNASDVFVVGCQHNDYIHAELVALLDPPTLYLARPSVSHWDCSVP